MTENFDFDEWSTLANMSPKEFEDRRHHAIENVIANGTNVRRLRGLQCRIDLERRRARTPLKACIRLSSMMWDSFLEYRNELNQLARITSKPSCAKSVPTHPAAEAKIIPFPRTPRNWPV